MNSAFRRAFLISALLLSIASLASAQDNLDPLVAAKGIYSLKSNDADARVFDVTFAPGGKTGMHQHPKHIVYVVKGGKIKIVEEGKAEQVMELKAGDVVTLAPQTHWAENLGKTKIHLVVVELKGK